MCGGTHAAGLAAHFQSPARGHCSEGIEHLCAPLGLLVAGDACLQGTSAFAPPAHFAGSPSADVAQRHPAAAHTSAPHRSSAGARDSTQALQPLPVLLCLAARQGKRHLKANAAMQPLQLQPLLEDSQLWAASRTTCKSVDRLCRARTLPGLPRQSPAFCEQPPLEACGTSKLQLRKHCTPFGDSLGSQLG